MRRRDGEEEEQREEGEKGGWEVEKWGGRGR